MQLKPGLIILFLLMLFGCKPKAALEFNEKINAIEASLLNDVKTTDDNVSVFFERQQYDSAAASSQRMEELVAVKLKEVESLQVPNVKEGDNLKKAAIRYFSYMKKIYGTYKTFALQPTEEERRNLVRVSEGAKDALEDIQNAQKKYAKANGFRIENK